MKLTEYAVKNYQFTLVLFVMVTIVGIVTLLTMPRAEDPQISPPTFPIIAIYPGTSPKDMEELVVKPIEKKMYELENVDKIVTTIEDGLAVIRVEFKYGVIVDSKYQEVVREISSLKNELPSDIYSLEVKKVDPSDVNILQVALVSENASYQVLRRNAEELKERLEKITSLKNVDFTGCPEEIVRVDVHIDKLAQQKIPLSLVLGSLQSEAANIPGGVVQVSTKSFNVKTSGKFESIEDIANTVVFNANGTIILLKDIADVGLRYAEEKHITRVNGHRCVLVNAAQKVGSNITQNQARMLPILDEFEKTLPANVKLIRTFDQASNVARRLVALGIDFGLAIVLVLITLLPLGIRAALIVMMAIPLSLALGLVGLNALGFSLNQLSIVGLVVALGLLVDDSIVVVENIERWLREGYSAREAAIQATNQIALAVLGCTATLVIAFLPLIFLPGGPGEFVRGLPMAVISSVIASMVVSLTIVPFLASRILQTHHNPEGNVFLRLLKKLISGSYSRLLERALKRPVLTLCLSMLIFAASLGLFRVIGFRLFPTSEKPIFLVNVRMPLQTNLQENRRITAMIEDSLRRNTEIAYFTSNVGKGNPQIYYNVSQQNEKSDFAQVFVQLRDEAKPYEKKRLIEGLRSQFEAFPLAKIEVKDFEQGPPIEAPISIRLLGDNLDTLRRLASQVEQMVRQSPGAIYTNNELNVLKTDIKVRINKEKARTLGVLTVDVDKTVRMAVAGLEIGTYTDDKGDDYNILVTTPKNNVATLAAFENLYVNNAIGTPIPLKQIAAITFESSPTTINHFNKNRFAKITAFTEKGVLANTVLKDVVPKLNALAFPQGYSYALAGEAESESDAFGGGFVVVILLTVFLFIAVLILQFKTFKGIVIVLSVIPLGVVGGVTMLFLTGNPMSFIAIIGFIGLAGIEVKNSILLVDFTNQLRSEGIELNKAIEQAGEIRFLPVVLTSLTAIGGLIPIALNPNPLISPLALVLIGGLLSSTILSRIVTPVLYKLIPPEVAVNGAAKTLAT
jgi:multidrug efflux pump subunit AcrB